MEAFYSKKTNEYIDQYLTQCAGRLWLNQRLPGSAWACIDAIIAELKTRTGDETCGRYDARRALAKAKRLLNQRSCRQ